MLNRTRIWLFLIASLLINAIHAQDATDTVPLLPGQFIGAGSNRSQLPPLVIAVDRFTPPFSMQGGNGELYGFDISLMNSLCKIMNRTCTFQVMKWKDLLPSIMNNEVDFAVSSITITPERTKIMNFSLPYALSNSRFLTNADTVLSEPFNIHELDNKTIGVNEGTVFADQATHMGIVNPTIQTYEGYQDALKALTDKDIDYFLVDNPTALYWAANSSGVFKTAGPPYVYGYGIAIAVKKADTNLIPALNQALLQYQNSEDYKANYNRYLDSF